MKARIYNKYMALVSEEKRQSMINLVRLQEQAVEQRKIQKKHYRKYKWIIPPLMPVLLIAVWVWVLIESRNGRFGYDYELVLFYVNSLNYIAAAIMIWYGYRIARYRSGMKGIEALLFALFNSALSFFVIFLLVLGMCVFLVHDASLESISDGLKSMYAITTGVMLLIGTIKNRFTFKKK